LQHLRQTSGPEWDTHWQKLRYLSRGYVFLAYNQQHPFFKDVRVRRALSHAINSQDIIKGVLLGQGEPTVGPYQPGTWVYNDALTPIAHDLDKARQLLAEAGIKNRNRRGLLEVPVENPDGTISYHPFSFTLLINQGNEQRGKIAVIIQAQLKELGIEVRIRSVEWAAFINDFVNPRRFETLILGWNILPDPDLSDVWHSSRIAPGGLNFMGFNSPEADFLLETAAASLDQEERKRLYDRFQEILYEEQPYTFLYVPYSLPIIQARIRGIEPAPAGIMHNFRQWWDASIPPQELQPALIP
jgi:peptide/nickel transport system substrate-binding protein